MFGPDFASTLEWLVQVQDSLREAGLKLKARCSVLLQLGSWKGAAGDRLDGVLGLLGQHLGVRSKLCFDPRAVGPGAGPEAKSKRKCCPKRKFLSSGMSCRPAGSEPTRQVPASEVGRS